MPERIYISNIGEYFDDCLTIEATLNNRTRSAELASLASERLMQKKNTREELVQYLADKRGISFEEMWQLILAGEYKPLSTEETKSLSKIRKEANQNKLD